MASLPSSDYRIAGSSVRDLTERLTAEKVRIKRMGIRFQGRSLREAHVLNAVLAYVLDLPPTQRTDVIERGLKRFEELLTAEGERLRREALELEAGRPIGATGPVNRLRGRKGTDRGEEATGKS